MVLRPEPTLQYDQACVFTPRSALKNQDRTLLMFTLIHKPLQVLLSHYLSPALTIG